EPQAPATIVELDDEPNVAEELADVFAELGTLDEVRVHISRHNPKTGRLAVIPSMLASEFSIDRLAELYGGGRFTLHVRQGRKHIVKKTVEIDGTVKGTVPEGGSAPAAAAPREPGTLEHIVDQVLAKLPQPAPAAAAPSLKDRLEEVKVIEEILKPSQPVAVERVEQRTLKDQLEERKLVRELLDDMGGGGPRSEISEWVGVARDLGLPLVNWIKEQVTAQQGRTGIPPAVAAKMGNAPTNPHADNATAGASAGDPNVPAWLQELGTWIPAMLADASKGTDPVSFAEYMYARLTPPTKVEVGRFVAQEDALDKLLAVVPLLKPHAEWVEEVLETVAEI